MGCHRGGSVSVATMTDAKRTILARRARFIAAALAGVGCTPPATQGAQSVVIPPLDAGAPPLPIATADPPDLRDAAALATRRDRDRDGVDDDDDACPDEPGAPSDVARNNGCPPRVIVSVCLSIVAPPKVTFAQGGATPTTTSALDAIAHVLIGNPQVTVEIGKNRVTKSGFCAKSGRRTLIATGRSTAS